jgi:hypothetical protein
MARVWWNNKPFFTAVNNAQRFGGVASGRRRPCEVLNDTGIRVAEKGMVEHQAGIAPASAVLQTVV